MSKKKVSVLFLLFIIFLFTLISNAENTKKSEINFKTKILSVNGNIIKVEVQTPTNEKIIIITKKNKDFKISKGNTNWYFHPIIKGNEICFKITKQVNDKREWNDCCAECAGGFTVCASIGVCCHKNGNCCEAGCPCKKKK